MKIFCSVDLFWFQSYGSRELYGRHTDLIHKFDASVICGMKLNVLMVSVTLSQK